MHVVAGDFDEDPTLPESKVVQIGHFRIGLIHGHQIVPWGDSAALSIVQRRLGCDILVSGHTHRNDVMEQEGKWFVNPGSMTGAYSHTAFSEGEVVPSFMLLAIKGSKCVTYVYELKNGEVEISKSEFVKKE
jgi:vacuolar protein sorting-associated protein 29